jgi:hypothetical protein
MIVSGIVRILGRFPLTIMSRRSLRVTWGIVRRVRDHGAVAGQGLIEELEDRWILPFRSKRVEQIRIDHRLGLLLDSDAEVTLEGPATLTQGPITAPGAAPAELSPENRTVAPALALLHTVVLSAVAFKSGALRLVFSNAMLLNVSPDTQHEAWTASGPGSMKCVCLPGGELAVWQ